MTWRIKDLMIQQPDLHTFSDEYRVYIESLLTTLRNSPNTVRIDIPPESGYLYRFDITSFLLDNNVPLEDHELVMRMNGITSIHQIDEDLDHLLLPDQSQVAQYKQIFRSKLSA